MGLVFCCVWFVVRRQVGGQEWLGGRHLGRKGDVSWFSGCRRYLVSSFFNPTKERTEAARQSQTGRTGAASLLPGEMPPRNRGQEPGSPDFRLQIPLQTLDSGRGIGVRVWRSREEEDGSQCGWDDKPANRKKRGKRSHGLRGNPARVRCVECLKGRLRMQRRGPSEARERGASCHSPRRPLTNPEGREGRQPQQSAARKGWGLGLSCGPRQ